MAENPNEIAELVALVRSGGVKARQIADEFFDQSPILGGLEIDDSATLAAGHTVFYFKPSEGLLGCLSALRAGDPNGEAFFDGQVHDPNIALQSVLSSI